jgi:hypothetical protein
MSLRPADQAVLDDLGLDWEVGSDGAFVTVTVRELRLPQGVMPAAADLLLRLPPGFPDVGPDMFWLQPNVSRSDGSPVPGTESIETYAGTAWQRWSRHIGNQWRPGIDNLGTYFAYIRRCLDQAATGAA